ncbi:MAG: tRNA (adenosine(37)-N6)-threonylcarbamoyltransferase complex ATPase subunit type 1 TsaE [Alphaproteobacteria bacterium CG11_big_fil_rev_8_21_14_0_20_44_7]|nr:MAG: tRNA (adenosine(37)-N6)-threonylcarbamoyltransferase complex ATPase subunit type 1 TsaE [Alphaproteobacteria bacterium CG11_big_fil_rev_8_21_14_0_20_44_7]
MQYIANLEKTKEIAAELAKKARKGDCFCLTGDLGSGKTEFSRSFIQEICSNANVSSPTFNIMQIYEVSGSTIYHFDLYRLADTEELVEIGLEDALAGGICLIEWPEIAGEILPKDARNIKFEIIDEFTRKITIQ